MSEPVDVEEVLQPASAWRDEPETPTTAQPQQQVAENEAVVFIDVVPTSPEEAVSPDAASGDNVANAEELPAGFDGVGGPGADIDTAAEGATDAASMPTGVAAAFDGSGDPLEDATPADLVGGLEGNQQAAQDAAADGSVLPDEQQQAYDEAAATLSAGETDDVPADDAAEPGQQQSADAEAEDVTAEQEQPGGPQVTEAVDVVGAEEEQAYSSSAEDAALYGSAAVTAEQPLTGEAEEPEAEALGQQEQQQQQQEAEEPVLDTDAEGTAGFGSPNSVPAIDKQAQEQAQEQEQQQAEEQLEQLVEQEVTQGLLEADPETEAGANEELDMQASQPAQAQGAVVEERDVVDAVGQPGAEELSFDSAPAGDAGVFGSALPSVVSDALASLGLPQEEEEEQPQQQQPAAEAEAEGGGGRGSAGEDVLGGGESYSSAAEEASGGAGSGSEKRSAGEADAEAGEGEEEEYEDDVAQNTAGQSGDVGTSQEVEEPSPAAAATQRAFAAKDDEAEEEQKQPDQQPSYSGASEALSEGLGGGGNVTSAAKAESDAGGSSLSYSGLTEADDVTSAEAPSALPAPPPAAVLPPPQQLEPLPQPRSSQQQGAAEPSLPTSPHLPPISLAPSKVPFQPSLPLSPSSQRAPPLPGSPYAAEPRSNGRSSNGSSPSKVKPAAAAAAPSSKPRGSGSRSSASPIQSPSSTSAGDATAAAAPAAAAPPQRSQPRQQQPPQATKSPAHAPQPAPPQQQQQPAKAAAVAAATPMKIRDVLTSSDAPDPQSITQQYLKLLQAGALKRPTTAPEGTDNIGAPGPSPASATAAAAPSAISAPSSAAGVRHRPGTGASTASGTSGVSNFSAHGLELARLQARTAWEVSPLQRSSRSGSGGGQSPDAAAHQAQQQPDADGRTSPSGSRILPPLNGSASAAAAAASSGRRPRSNSSSQSTPTSPQKFAFRASRQDVPSKVFAPSHTGSAAPYVKLYTPGPGAYSPSVFRRGDSSGLGGASFGGGSPPRSWAFGGATQRPAHVCIPHPAYSPGPVYLPSKDGTSTLTSPVHHKFDKYLTGGRFSYTAGQPRNAPLFNPGPGAYKPDTTAAGDSLSPGATGIQPAYSFAHTAKLLTPALNGAALPVLSKEHVREFYGSLSPGPAHYSPDTSPTRPSIPAYSSPGRRSCWFDPVELSPGPVYKPAELDRVGRHTLGDKPHAVIGTGPKAYDPNGALSASAWLSLNHARRANYGVHSPGPVYLPHDPRVGNVPTPAIGGGPKDRFTERSEPGRLQ